MKRYDSSFNSENTVSKVVFAPQVNFEFTNIGSILGGVVGIIGEMAIEMSKVFYMQFFQLHNPHVCNRIYTVCTVKQQ